MTKPILPAEISDRAFLRAMANMRMPFGKYQGRLLVDLPEPYVVWFNQHGFPPGTLGRMLATLYVIKVNGLEYLLRRIRDNDTDVVAPCHE